MPYFVRHPSTVTLGRESASLPNRSRHLLGPRGPWDPTAIWKCWKLKFSSHDIVLTCRLAFRSMASVQCSLPPADQALRGSTSTLQSWKASGTGQWIALRVVPTRVYLKLQRLQLRFLWGHLRWLRKELLLLQANRLARCLGKDSVRGIQLFPFGEGSRYCICFGWISRQSYSQ